jgi:hypothetical protein
MNDPLQRLIESSRQTPPPEPGGPPPFLHTRVMASVRAAEAAAPRRQWAALSLGSLPVAVAIAAVCAWQGPFSPAPETTPAGEDSASLIAAALIDSTIPQP